MSQTITALYDVLSQAEAAQAKLVAAGIPQSAIRLVPGTRTGTATTTRASTGGRLLGFAQRHVHA